MRYPLIRSGVTALLLVQILCLPPTGGALGQATENKGAVTATPMDAACSQELQQFCAGVQPGQGRLIQCLAGRPSGDLSSACKTFVAQARQGCAPAGLPSCAAQFPRPNYSPGPRTRGQVAVSSRGVHPPPQHAHINEANPP